MFNNQEEFFQYKNECQWSRIGGFVILRWVN